MTRLGRNHDRHPDSHRVVLILLRLTPTQRPDRSRSVVIQTVGIRNAHRISGAHTTAACLGQRSVCYLARLLADYSRAGAVKDPATWQSTTLTRNIHDSLVKEHRRSPSPDGMSTTEICNVCSGSGSRWPLADGGEGVRTLDPRLAKPVLSQLSYAPGVWPRGSCERVSPALT